MEYDNWMVSVGIEPSGFDNDVLQAYKNQLYYDDHIILGSRLKTGDGHNYISKEELKNKIIYFTSSLPEVTFTIIYTSFYLNDVTVWKIKNDTILEEDYLDLNNITLPSGISLDIRPENVIAANVEILDDYLDHINRKLDRIFYY